MYILFLILYVLPRFFFFFPLFPRSPAVLLSREVPEISSLLIASLLPSLHASKRASFSFHCDWYRCFPSFFFPFSPFVLKSRSALLQAELGFLSSSPSSFSSSRPPPINGLPVHHDGPYVKLRLRLAAAVVLFG